MYYTVLLANGGRKITFGFHQFTVITVTYQGPGKRLPNVIQFPLLANKLQSGSLILDLHNFTYIHAKVQLISKDILVPSILPKNELENFNFCPSLLGQKFFVRFLEKLKKKCPFEII